MALKRVADKMHYTWCGISSLQQETKSAPKMSYAVSVQGPLS